MYARIQTADQVPDMQGPGDFDRLVDTIAGHPGFAGLYALQPVDSAGLRLVTLWDSEDDARNSADRTHAQLGPHPVELTTDLIYEVRDDDHGVAFDATPTAASIAWFAGPMSEARAAIGRRARRERIAPAVIAIPGVVRLISLFQADTQEPCTLSLLTSAEVGPAVRAVLDVVELAPEEGWVRNPDRTEFFGVAATAAGRAGRAAATGQH